MWEKKAINRKYSKEKRAHQALKVEYILRVSKSPLLKCVIIKYCKFYRKSSAEWKATFFIVKLL